MVILLGDVKRKYRGGRGISWIKILIFYFGLDDLSMVGFVARYIDNFKKFGGKRGKYHEGLTYQPWKIL